MITNAKSNKYKISVFLSYWSFQWNRETFSSRLLNQKGYEVTALAIDRSKSKLTKLAKETLKL